MPKNVASVTSLVSYLKRQLDKDGKIQNLFVRGEISNFTQHRSNHLYFTLKDKGSRIACVMFKGNAQSLNFHPKNGDQVLLNVNTSLYINSGSLQLYVNSMELDGVGNLFLNFEKLKKQLESEGLFNIRHKKTINRYPKKIGIVVGKNTAAREDIITTLARRWPIAELFEINTLVQGEMASSQIINSLLTLDKKSCDTIILARGGGSFEDLNCFNDEGLARVIFNLQTPIITGIGHEVDFTIADFVADIRAATPTASAEVCVNDILEVKNVIDINKSKLNNLCYNIINSKKRELKNLQNAQIFTNPSIIFKQKNLKIANLEQGLDNFLYTFQNKSSKLEKLQNKLVNFINDTIKYNQVTLNNCQKHMEIALIGIKQGKEESLSNYQNSLNITVKNIYKEYHHDFINKIGLLDAYSPLKSLSRGYSLVYKKDELVKRVSQLSLNDEVKLVLDDGIVKASIKEIKDGK